MRVARVLLPVLACAFALTFSTQAAQAAGTILRPTSGGTYAYSAPEATPYVTARAVVHYVATGPQAPPLTDADGNGIPDYVQQVGADADVALAYYEQHGFRQPLPDTAGPDTKPDIYVDTLATGVFGLTLTESQAEGGTFVLVSPNLDVSTTNPHGSVDITVAHELFHVIQFSYFANDQIPLWAAEGSAAALSMLVFPRVEDLVMTDYLDSWLRSPWLPLYDERKSCVHCYGGAWWWLYLADLSPKILPRYFARLQADDRRGKSTRVGVSQLDAALKESGVGSLDHVFTRFSMSLYRSGLPVGDAYSLKSSTSFRASPVRGVYGLSAHYVPITVPSRARGVVVSVPYGKGPRPHATLVVGGPHGRQIVAKQSRSRRGFVLSTLFRNRGERRKIVLIVTSGSLNGVLYQVHYAAVGAHGRLPGWIAY
jgi:hypothetical protein